MPVRPSHMAIDQISHRYIAPSSAAFRPDSGEDGLSVYRDKVLSSRGLGPQHVAAAGRVPSIVAGLIDAQIHVHGLAIESDPMPVPPDVSAAHALVTGWHSMSDKQSRRVARELARSAICTFPDSDWHVAATMVLTTR